MKNRNLKSEVERDVSFLKEILDDLKAAQDGDPIRQQDAIGKIEDWINELEQP